MQTPVCATTTGWSASLTSSDPSSTGRNKVAILWDTFGPQHVDRLNVVAQRYPDVVGVELFAQSDQYDWTWHPERNYEHITFRKARTSPLRDGLMTVRRLLGLRFSRGINVWFLCNYERLYIFVSAWLQQAVFVGVFDDEVFLVA